MMDLSNLHLEEPSWLWLAAAVLALVVVLFRRASIARRRQLAQIASPRFLAELTASHSAARRTIKQVMLLLAIACIGLALARPQWGHVETRSEWLGEDVVFALDCSRSMLASDVLPGRLQRAKLSILDFVRHHGRGRVGLVAFAGSAFLQCPLTLDYDSFERSLQDVDDKTIPVPGTDVGRALTEANRAMEKRSRRKLIVLLTDGEDLEKTGVRTAESLATNGVVVFTVGVGSPAGAEIRVVNPSGQPDFVRDTHGDIVRSRLDEETLQAIAKATGGNYFPLGPRGEGLGGVQQAVDTLDRAREVAHLRGVEHFHVPVAAAVVLLVIESLLGTRRRGDTIVRPEPREKGVPAGRALLWVIIGSFFGAVSVGSVRAAGNFTDFSPAPATPAPGSARELYNAGTRLLGENKLNDAEVQLRAALAKQDDRLQPAALYNLGEVRFAQGSELLRKAPSAKDFTSRTRAIDDMGERVTRQLRDAASGSDVQKMVEAYKAGRGVRKEARDVIEAYNRAMESYGATLLKWRRSLGDFRSAAELNPGDTNAVRNAEIVQREIAKLIDRVRRMQQAMMPMAGGRSEFGDLMKQLKGQIPKEMMPPGASVGDDEDEPVTVDMLRGAEEGLSKGGEEMQLSPEDASALLKGLNLKEKSGLPVGPDGKAQSADRHGRTW